MKKGSANLVVLSIIFLLTALLIYLFEYISIERMMYLNRSNMKQFNYNYESLVNIITKDIEGTYSNGGEITDLLNKDYSVFEGQKAQIFLNNITNKNAFSIYYSEILKNNREKTREKNFSLLNKIFYKKQLKRKEKEDFLNIIKENQVQEFTVEEINNYFLNANDGNEVFDYGQSVIKITQAASESEINATIKGSGILIIEGDVTIRSRINFSGLIVIDGELKIDGDSDIYGAIIDLNNKSSIKYTKSLNSMYQNCKNYKGIIKVSKSN